MTFFSVIIPLYNKEKFIENTLNSVFNQSFVDFEVIIVNDGSTDKSESIIKYFDDARIRYFYQENKGVSVARNFGIAVAQSNYITFIDADDYWYPNFLQEIFNNINQFSEQKVFTAAIEIETSKSIIPAQYSIEKTKECQVVDYFEASYKTTAICTSCAVFHKSVFDEIGDFDTNIKSGQDTDLWIRIGLKYSVLFCWKILARYVFDSQSLSKKSEFIVQKLDFTKFQEIEKTHLGLKKFLDLNRYALALKCKLNGDKINFEHFYKMIDLRNLSLKKRLLLQLPSFCLKKLIQLNLYLTQIGLSKSVFK